MPKYFTIVIRADNDAQDFAARKLVPGELLGSNPIVGVSLGDALTLNDKLKALIPSEKEDAVSELEAVDLAPHFTRKS